MKKFIVSKLYDLLVYLTCNYSEMPDEFKERFPEMDCIGMRQDLFNIISDYENGKSLNLYSTSGSEGEKSTSLS